jgi:hypothetical protein
MAWMAERAEELERAVFAGTTRPEASGAAAKAEKAVKAERARTERGRIMISLLKHSGLLAETSPRAAGFHPDFALEQFRFEC